MIFFLVYVNELTEVEEPPKKSQQDTGFVSRILSTLSIERTKSWNEEFQEILHLEDCKEKFLKLSNLSRDFVFTAQTYGRIIIRGKFIVSFLKNPRIDITSL